MVKSRSSRCQFNIMERQDKVKVKSLSSPRHVHAESRWSHCQVKVTFIPSEGQANENQTQGQSTSSQGMTWRGQVKSMTSQYSILNSRQCQARVNIMSMSSQCQVKFRIKSRQSSSQGQVNSTSSRGQVEVKPRSSRGQVKIISKVKSMSMWSQGRQYQVNVDKVKSMSSQWQAKAKSKSNQGRIKVKSRPRQGQTKFTSRSSNCQVKVSSRSSQNDVEIKTNYRCRSIQSHVDSKSNSSYCQVKVTLMPSHCQVKVTCICHSSNLRSRSVKVKPRSGQYWLKVKSRWN